MKRVFLIAKPFNVLVCCVSIAVLVSGKVSRKRQEGTEHRLQKLSVNCAVESKILSTAEFLQLSEALINFDFTYLVCEWSEEQTRIFVCCHYRAIKQWPTKWSLSTVKKKMIR